MQPAAVAPDGMAPSSPTGADNTFSAKRSGLHADVSDLRSRIVGAKLVLELPADVLFEFDSATLRPGAIAALRKAATIAARAPQGGIEVIGHTDAKGSDAYNDTLSLQRAKAVRDWLARQPDLRGRSFNVKGRGEAEPVVPNTTFEGADDPDGRARNRRVELELPR